jgi:DNA-binding NarL/FixJ family response regulator
MSNREIASAIHVTVKTVEYNLTTIYRKLGVRSRTQLASRLADQRAGGSAGPVTGGRAS